MPGKTHMAQHRGCIITLLTALNAGDTSGMEVEAGPDLGLWFFHVGVDQTNGVYDITIDLATRFDAAINVVVPIMVFGNEALTSVCRTGRVVGGLNFAGTYRPEAKSINLQSPFYLPPGKLLTVMNRTQNAAAECTFAFWEDD